jgi:predicted outer membrane repeat protein
MKIILFFCSLWLILGFNVVASNQPDTLFWSGTIDIYENLYVDEQTTLIISPGTVVTAHNQSKIETRGNVFAIGQFDNKIIFTAADTTGLYDTATINGGWGGFHLLDNPNGEAHFKHCTFEYGKANIPGTWYGSEGSSDDLEGNQGGAFRITYYQNITFDYCNFYNNFARTKGGAIYCRKAHNLIFTNCDFTQNMVLAYGGAIYYYDFIYNLQIEHCVFKRNIAWSKTSTNDVFRHGAALFIMSWGPPESQCLIQNTYFFNNISLTTLALLNKKSSVVNNIFTNNFNFSTIHFGMLESEHFAYNNTIANNYYNSGIPGVSSFSSQLHFYNNILWNNFSDSIADNDKALTWLSSPPDVQYCLVWESRIDGENIIMDDPLFVSPAPGYGLDYNGWEYDWSLQDDSPAVNTGTPDTTGLHIPPFDLLGNPRIFGGRIDMGAYENQNVWVSLPENPLVKAKMVAAPNPFRNAFTVELFDPEKVRRITVYNQTGIIVRQIETLWHEGLVSIDMSGFASGLYILVVEYENGTVKTEKMVKL